MSIIEADKSCLFIVGSSNSSSLIHQGAHSAELLLARDFTKWL